MRKGLALATAAVAFGALGLQLSLMVAAHLAEGSGVVRAVWRFLGYFTLLTNLGVAVVASLLVFRPGWAGPRVRLATLVSIALVGLVYSLALRHAWSPTGAQKLADHALHDVTPLLFAACWLAWDHGRLTWRDALWGIAPGLAYAVYALARGAADGWYAYWFLDPMQSSPLELARNIAILALGFLAAAMAIVALDRRLGSPIRPVER